MPPDWAVPIGAADWARPAASAALLGVLVWLSVIDLRIRRLPDRIVLPTLWAGLALNAVGMFTAPADAICGAILGYGSLWSLSAIYSLRATAAMNGAAMGGGDLKTAAMIGAWVGAAALPGVLLIAFVTGACAALPLLALRRCRAGDAIPFGPALALGGAAAVLGGGDLDRLLFGL